MPIHNGTFDLAMHTWHEPFERILALGTNHDVLISTPGIGEALNILNPHKGKAWWRDLNKSPHNRFISRFSLCLDGHKHSKAVISKVNNFSTWWLDKLISR